MTSTSIGRLISIEDLVFDPPEPPVKKSKESNPKEQKEKKPPAPLQPAMNFSGREKSAEKIVDLELLMSQLKTTVRSNRVEFYFLCASEVTLLARTRN